MPETDTQPTPKAGESDDQSLAPLAIIRTETILSKLPIHNLEKKGSRTIKIIRQNEQGDIDLLWKVTPNAAYGEPRELAYKLDTLVINRRIEEQGRPLPEFLRVGSLRDIAQQLNLGGDTNKIKKALSQNAHTVLTAEFSYTDKNGGQQHAEFQTTRYGLIFTGEKLPNGRKADAVYITLNPPYRHILNNALFRPLNYNYLKELPPAAQRFYELISYRIFAALNNNRSEARITYSDLCTFAPLQRYEDYDHFKKQMYKIHRPHLKSSYLAATRYEPITDRYGKPDWDMFYTPGAKAHTEYDTFTGKRSKFQPAAPSPDDPQSRGDLTNNPLTTPPIEIDPRLIELTKRGISEKAAARLLANLPEGQEILDQLEWADFLINQQNQQEPGKIRNPSGFYIYLLKENITLPDTFESTRQRRRREQAEEAAQRKDSEKFELDLAFKLRRRQELDNWIAANPAKYEELLSSKQLERSAQYPKLFDNWTTEAIRSYCDNFVRADLAKILPLPTFEEFRAQHQTTTHQLNLSYGEQGAGETQQPTP